MRNRLLWPGLVFGLGVLANQPQQAVADQIHWQAWSNQAFLQAEKEHKLVLLDLEAVWCHWCHVMNQDTYGDPLIIANINQHYIPVRVDQDTRPDLANRFRDYGWPATIIFTAQRQPLAKRAGYIEPTEMNKLLSHLPQNPQPEEAEEPSKPALKAQNDSYQLAPDLKKALAQEYLDSYDQRFGSWGVGGDKFLDLDSVEYAMRLAQAGDINATRMAQKTLSQVRHLIDPVWGGVYQYSTHGDWQHPHTEKIMQVQADALQAYSLAYAMWHRPEDLQAARAIKQYLDTFLRSPDGAFYTSQDADLNPGKQAHGYFQLNDRERRQRGIPRIDQHIYSRENGWAICSLLSYYNATGDRSAQQDAQLTANWIIQHRLMPGGGFRHDENDQGAGPYLADSLAMGQAFLALYTSTSDRYWLTRSTQVADFINAHFSPKNQQAGYTTTASEPVPYTDRLENLRLARWTNLLSYITGQKKYRHMAEQAMRFVANPTIAQEGFAAAPLLAAAELESSPLHLTVIGKKTDPNAQQLFQTALAYPTAYKQVEFWDSQEASSSGSDVVYPTLPQAAAFICTNHRCSLPIFQPAELRPRIEQLSRKANQKGKL